MTDGFHQQLADDPPAAGPDGTADGELMLARAATGQQKDGAIGAADDQQEHNAGKKELQGSAGILLENPDDRRQREMQVGENAPGTLFKFLEQNGLEHRVGGGTRDVGPELDHQYVGHGGPGGSADSRRSTGRQVDIAHPSHVIESEAAWHDTNDGVGGVIDFQCSLDNVGIAAEVALPELVVENNHGAAAVLRIGWLEVAAEKRAHTKESSGILCEVVAPYIFRQCAAGDLHVRGVEAEHRFNRCCKAHLIKLCLANVRIHNLDLVRISVVDGEEVHDAVGVGVGKRVQQDGVDE